MPTSPEQLEIKIAWLEQANTQLSEEVYRHRRQIEALNERLSALVSRLDAAQEAPTTYSAADEKPPHY